jgi:hypothetical protein
VHKTGKGFGFSDSTASVTVPVEGLETCFGDFTFFNRLEYVGKDEQTHVA